MNKSKSPPSKYGKLTIDLDKTFNGDSLGKLIEKAIRSGRTDLAYVRDGSEKRCLAEWFPDSVEWHSFLGNLYRDQGKYDRGWKDTVDLLPGEVVEVAVRFTDHAGRFVMHCHNLEHEDMAMMATIRTV